MSNNSRREVILDIINTQEVGTQEELTRLLAEKGFDCTQATVSRDINALNLKKVKGLSGLRYVAPAKKIDEIQKDKIFVLLKTFVVSIKRAQNLIVIKTLAGNGSSCGMAVDNLELDGVVGSIAGDDTLLVILEDDKAAIRTVDILYNIVGL